MFPMMRSITEVQGVKHRANSDKFMSRSTTILGSASKSEQLLAAPLLLQQADL
jgi:hypothetical protein